MDPEMIPGVESTGDRLTRIVKTHLSEAEWALFERQAQVETLQDAYRQAIQEIDASHKRIATMEQILSAYVEKYGALPPPDAETDALSPLVPDDPTELVERLNGLEKLRQKRDRARASAGD